MTQVFQSLIDKLHRGVNPYDGFPRGQVAVENIPWATQGPQDPWFHEEIDRLKPSLVVEVGSLLGWSAIWMAQHLKELKLDSAVLCIDTWLTDKQFWEDEQWRPRMRFTFGRPELYHTFLANVLATDLQDYIVPLPMDSTSAYHYIRSRGVQAQLVYIDGSHEMGSAYADFCHYWDGILLPGGTLLADDVHTGHPEYGVDVAIDRFTRERGIVGEFASHRARFHK